MRQNLVTKKALAFMLCLVASHFVLAEDHRVFPGAEGFGATAKGGRGGRLIRVTTLNDRGCGSSRRRVGKTRPRRMRHRQRPSPGA